MLVDGFRTCLSLESLRPEVCVDPERISKAVELVQLVPAKPSSASRPVEDAGAGDAAATDGAAP